MKLPVFLQCSVLFVLAACNSQKPDVTKHSSVAQSETAKTNENNIVYLFFEIEKTSNRTETVKHTNTTIKQGILKSASVDTKEKTTGNFIISMLSKNGEIIEERIIEDPLNPVLESYSEEGLEKKQVNLRKAEFSVRFNQKGDVASVKIEKITAESKKHLMTIQL